MTNREKERHREADRYRYRTNRQRDRHQIGQTPDRTDTRQEQERHILIFENLSKNLNKPMGLLSGNYGIVLYIRASSCFFFSSISMPILVRAFLKSSSAFLLSEKSPVIAISLVTGFKRHGTVNLSSV